MDTERGLRCEGESIWRGGPLLVHTTADGVDHACPPPQAYQFYEMKKCSE